ncbi:MAG: hypothetical protein KF871_09755 [Hydrogenophaga sp.]|uniref:hypothetical protein n=1 Tax=Hydrogenophaga sp. TaxID=1904254 RepID=UPI001DAA29FD|nr:hypothetical protein [Hydrogenophaga sp.]MBX3610170.1 hypothetical protein [Hydrogenophaga sp.]
MSTALDSPPASHPVFALDPLHDELLERFALGMSRRGICLSRTLMCSDPRYAVVQLAQAQTLLDPELNSLAVALFQAFQAQRSGLPSIH